jgi:hypothetical protein
MARERPQRPLQAAARILAFREHFGPADTIAHEMASDDNSTVAGNGIPAYEDLPLRKGDPPYSAWGLYGPSDQLGMLNRLTDERVAAAAKNEIQSGTR